MDAETITLLQAGIFFNHFLQRHEIAYTQYIMGHLMSRRPPISVETISAMAVPKGYAPPHAVQPDMPHPPQPIVSPEHDVSLDDDVNDQQGRDNFGGVDFGDAEQPPPYHPIGTPHAVPRFDAAGPSYILMMLAPSTYQVSPSHQPDYSVPPMTMYYFPPIPLTYQAIQDGMPVSRDISRNTVYGQRYFPLPLDMRDHPV